MKLSLDQTGDLNVFTGYGPDHVMIRKIRFDGNLIVTPARIEHGWADGGFDRLQPSDFVRVVELGAEIVLIGTGARQRFPNPSLLRPLIEARIGFECMDLGSACRTYNILANEGRNVAAALLFEPA